MALKDYMADDAKKILMDTNEFAENVEYIRSDGSISNVIVREDVLTFDNMQKKGGSNTVSNERRFYFSADFQPMVGDYLKIGGIHWKIIPPTNREAGLWIITVVKSARKNGVRKF